MFAQDALFLVRALEREQTEAQARRVFSHHNKMNCLQVCEPIADGEVVEVMQDGEEAAETIPIGHQVVKSELEFSSI